MKNNLRFFTGLLFALSLLLTVENLKAQHVTIIESESSAFWAVQDTVWQAVATAYGYTATIVQQSALDSLDSLANTDVLIVSSSLVSFSGTDHLQTVIDFIKSGRPAYIQAEYLSSYQGDITFQTLMDTLGENFSWTGTVSGQLVPMIILPPFSLYPDTVSSIDYFNYGQSGVGSGHIDSFLLYQGNYFGFYYHDSTSCNGAVITCSDEDWVWHDACPTLMTNMLYRLVHSPNCYSLVSPLQASAIVNYAPCDSPCSASATVAPEHGNPPYYYLWLPGSDTTATVNNLCTGSYLVKVTDSGGDSVLDTVTVLIPIAPVDTISPASTIFCPGDSTSICATTGYNSYLWSTGQTTNCIEAKTAGEYSVTAIDSNNCPIQSNQLSIAVYPPPVIAISDNGDTLTVYGDSAYQWYMNDSAIASATGPVYIATGPGAYSIAVVDSNGCSGISNQEIISGITNMYKYNLTISPNPAYNNWELSGTEGIIGSKAEIFDETGRLAYTAVINSEKTNISFDAGAGIYILNLATPDGTVVRQLVKLQ